MKNLSKFLIVGLTLTLVITLAGAELVMAQDLLLQNQERIEELEAKVKQLEEENDALREKLEQLSEFDEDNLNSLLSNFQELEDNYSELTNEVNKLNQDVQKLAQDGEGVNSEGTENLSNLSTQLNEVKQKTDQLEELIAQTKQSLNNRVSRLSNEIDKLKKANSELAEELNRLKEQNANLEKRVSKREDTTTAGSGESNGQDQEARQGTTLPFYDPFEEKPSSGWRITPVGRSTLGVEKGKFTIVDILIEDQPIKAFVGDSSWEDYVLSVDVSYQWTHGTYHQVALFVRAEDRNNMVGFFMQPGGKAGFWVKRQGVWGEMVSGQDISELEAYNVVISAEGDKYSATLNDQLIASMEYEGLQSGFVGLQSAADSRTGDLYKVFFDNFRVEPIE